MRLSKNEVKYLRALSQKKVRDEEKKFLLEGWKPILEALDAGAEIELCGVVPSSVQTAEQRGIVSRIQKAGIRTCDLSELELRQVAATVQAQGIVALVRQRHATVDDLIRTAPAVIVACDEVSDPGNLGSIIRTCHWFGVGHLLLGTGSVSLYNEKVVRATTGSLFHVTAAEGGDLVADLRRLRSNGYRIMVAAAEGTAPPNILRKIHKLVLVLGSEAHGVSAGVREIADDVVAIPRFGGAESLNVGVACGILLSALKDIVPRPTA